MCISVPCAIVQLTDEKVVKAAFSIFQSDGVLSLEGLASSGTIFKWHFECYNGASNVNGHIVVLQFIEAGDDPFITALEQKLGAGNFQLTQEAGRTIYTKIT